MGQEIGAVFRDPSLGNGRTLRDSRSFSRTADPFPAREKVVKLPVLTEEDWRKFDTISMKEFVIE